MPIQVQSTATEANTYGHPFVGPGAEYTDVVKVDISALTIREVDSAGNLKPGVPLLKTGLPVTAGAVYGVVLEATKLPLTVIPPTDVSLAAHTLDCFVALGTHGIVNRDIIEDNLGGALTAPEIAGFALAGSHIHLTRT